MAAPQSPAGFARFETERRSGKIEPRDPRFFLEEKALGVRCVTSTRRSHGGSSDPSRRVTRKGPGGSGPRSQMGTCGEAQAARWVVRWRHPRDRARGRASDARRERENEPKP